MLERLRALRLGLTVATTVMVTMAANGLLFSYAMRNDSVEIPVPGAASLCNLVDCPPLGEYEPPTITCRATEIRDLGQYCIDALHERFSSRQLRWIEMLDFTANASWIGAVGIGTVFVFERRQRRRSKGSASGPEPVDWDVLREDLPAGLKVGIDADGLVVVAGRPGLVPEVGLRLRPEGLEVFREGVGSLTLPWDDGAQASPGRPVLGDGHSWSLGPHACSRSSCFGLAVWVKPEFVPEAAPLADATTSWGRRLIGRRAPGDGLERRLPVFASGTDRGAVDRLRHTLSALCDVLKHRSDLRVRLAVRSRAEQLAHDLSVGSVPYATPLDADGVRRDTLDVGVALRSAGFLHAHNRPLWAGEHHPPLDECVAEVGRLLAANPYRTGRSIDPERLDELVRRYYVEVRPWPFSALVEP